MPSLRVLSPAVAVGALLAACSGASESRLFDSNPNASPDPVDASISPADASGGGAPDAAAAPIHDAAPPVHPDAAKPTPTPEAGPTDPGITCGSSSCNPASEVCCRTDPGTGNPSFACVPPSGCSAAGAMPIPCANASDCLAGGSPAGTICCVTEDPQTGHATTVACVDPSSCTDQTQTWLCDPNASDACPQGMVCTASKQTIPGYDICHP
jgi:hypothetical protein